MSRIYLAPEDPNVILAPIVGLSSSPAMPLAEAVAFAESADKKLHAAVVSEGYPDLQPFVACAIDAAAGMSASFPVEQRAAIHLYTQESPLYVALNAALRSANRQEIKPYFPYLRILLSGVAQCKVSSCTVYRGVKKNIASQYVPGKEITWWQLSSATVSVDVLNNPQFLGDCGDRTLFAIETKNAFCIQPYSAVAVEDEHLLLGGVKLLVKGILELGNGIKMVQLAEQAPPLMLGVANAILGKTEASKSNNAPTNTQKTNTVNAPQNAPVPAQSPVEVNSGELVISPAELVKFNGQATFRLGRLEFTCVGGTFSVEPYSYWLLPPTPAHTHLLWVQEATAEHRQQSGNPNRRAQLVIKFDVSAKAVALLLPAVKYDHSKSSYANPSVPCWKGAASLSQNSVTAQSVVASQSEFPRGFGQPLEPRIITFAGNEPHSTAGHFHASAKMLWHLRLVLPSLS